MHRSIALTKLPMCSKLRRLLISAIATEYPCLQPSIAAPDLVGHLTLHAMEERLNSAAMPVLSHFLLFEELLSW